MKAISNTLTLQQFNQELFSIVRRSINNLKEKQVKNRKQGINQLMRIIKQQQLPTSIFEQIMQMSLKQIIKCYYDHSEAIRENSINFTIEILSRCKIITFALPYILEALKDRTNCVDLEGIDKLPQKLRPNPGQKPKTMIKLIQNCQQIRILYCQLIKRIVFLLDKDQRQMIKHLDDMVNIQRALLMDPAPQIQKVACQTLQIFCDDYKDILLHFTENLGRAILLPLISKKSKIRIAALNTLTAILWCGLWKYNAFVFENLIGFRDPNSVPIKDFYQPNHNINYLATFITDSNVKVRRQFMTHIKIWVCDLNDKFDHHSKIVPYLLSGLSDQDQIIRNTALQTIDQIGRQIQEEKQKQFRQNKQFAVDSKWTWQGRLVNLPIDEPLKKRPSLGSRHFVRGHVRKFWTALYKQIRDIKEENRLRSAKLALFGAIYTENYLTQFLDNMIPQLLPSIIPSTPQDKKTAQYVSRIFFYIGRYCQQSAYIHLIQDALDGKLIQNQEFVRCAMKGLSMMIKGNLQAIPQGQSLCHKKDNIIQLLRILEQCKVAGDVYNFNCIQARQIAVSLFQGIQKKANQQQKQQILQQHLMNMLKLLCVSQYEKLYSDGFSMKKTQHVSANTSQIFKDFVEIIDRLLQLYQESMSQLQQYCQNMFCDPPSLMDSDWKILIILYRYFCYKGKSPQNLNSLILIQQALCSCINSNQSIEMLTFISKYLHNLVYINQKSTQNSLSASTPLLVSSIQNLQRFKPMKKVPVYDQHLVKDDDPSILKTSDTYYIQIFSEFSQTFVYYFINQIQIKQQELASLLINYLNCFSKVSRYPECVAESVRTIWGIFSKIENLNQEFPNNLVATKNKEQKRPAMPFVVDFCVQRLEEYLQSSLTSMTFSILQKIIKCWPTVNSIAQKLPNIYPAFPDLFQKIFKYALNEKDIETRQKYMDFLHKLAKKMPAWFKYEAQMAEKQRRYQKSRMLQDLLKQANLL